MSKTTDTLRGSKNAGKNTDRSSAGSEGERPQPMKMPRRRQGQTPTVEKLWYSKSEAARYLGVAEITVTRYLNKGVLRAQRLPASSSARVPGGGDVTRRSNYDYGRLRLHKSELDWYLESVDQRPNLADSERSSNPDCAGRQQLRPTGTCRGTRYRGRRTYDARGSCATAWSILAHHQAVY